MQVVLLSQSCAFVRYVLGVRGPLLRGDLRLINERVGVERSFLGVWALYLLASPSTAPHPSISHLTPRTSHLAPTPRTSHLAPTSHISHPTPHLPHNARPRIPLQRSASSSTTKIHATRLTPFITSLPWDHPNMYEVSGRAYRSRTCSGRVANR